MHPTTQPPTATLGYTRMSADNIGMDRKTITELIRAMQVNLDCVGVEDAEDYCRWEHGD